MKADKGKKVLIFLVIAVIGFLVVFQAKLVAKEGKAMGKDNAMRMAYEIINIANNNLRLQQELDQIRSRNNSSLFDINNQANIKSDMEQRIKNYKVANGLEPVSGRGVEITVEGSIVTEEMVDLINGSRNIKPKAIGLNSSRIIYSSYFVIDKGRLEFDNKMTDIPFKVQIIGDPETTKKSLDRAGGILDVLKKNSFGKIKFTITERESISLPAYDKKIGFRIGKQAN